MAKTREQWNVDIDAYALANSYSTSAAAEWRLLRDLVVTIAMWFEIIFELFRSDVDARLDNKQFGTLHWYVAIAKEFQYGYSLQVDEGIVKYSFIDNAARIVTQASAKELVSGTLALKVAKIVSGELAPLSGGELTAFRDYIKAHRAPGVRMNVASLGADLVRYTLNTVYDPIYDYSTVKTAIGEVLTSFRNNLRFDSIFYNERAEADVMTVDGVLSITGTWEWRNTATGLWETIVVSKELPAGYFNWDLGSDINLTAA